MKVAILGGSSPFTAALFQSLADRGPVRESSELILHGRAAKLLNAMSALGNHCLGATGWTVASTTSLEEALAGVDVVVNQIRFGDLAGRLADAEFAERFGVPGDETLGPAGFRTALRIAGPLHALGQTLKQRCPQAIVLNLTNPLSVATSILSQCGLQKVWGICELPDYTAQATARLLGVSWEGFGWSYVGLNHRGFVHGLRHDGWDISRRLFEQVPNASILGIPISLVRELGAIPTKHFAMVAGISRPSPGRAKEVSDIRDEAAAEICADSAAIPRCLSQRDMPWYSLALAPLLWHLEAGEPLDMALTISDDVGVSRERRYRIHQSTLAEIAGDDPPPAAARWVRQFEQNEIAVLEAIRSPSPNTIRAAVESDPVLQPAQTEDIAAALITEWHHLSSLQERVRP
jgi:6-phospho-beta-glucosidase